MGPSREVADEDRSRLQIQGRYESTLEEQVARMKATWIEPARPVSEHQVPLGHHSYLIRSVSGSDELALFDMFSRSSPEDLRLRCLGMIKDFLVSRLLALRAVIGNCEIAWWQSMAKARRRA